MAELDLYTLTIRGTLFGNQIVNSWGFMQISTTAGFLGQALIDEWQAACLTQYQGCSSQLATYDLLSARSIVPDSHVVVEESLTGITGAVSGEVSPNQVAGVITWRTALAGRSYRGRTYIPALPQSYVVSGLLSATGLGNYNTFRTAMMTAFAATGSSTNFRLGVISRVADGVARPTPLIQVVTSSVVRTIPGTQRRRRLGVGG